MKKLFFGALVACVAATFVACGNSTPKADLKNDVDTMSYAMGMSQTQGLKEFMVERMGVDTAYMDDFIKGLNDGANAGDDKKKAAYYAGIQIGQQISNQMVKGINHEVFGDDSTKTISLKNFMAGFITGTTGKKGLMTVEQAAQVAQTKMMAIKAKNMENKESNFHVLYEDELSLTEKIEKISKEIYGANGVVYEPAAKKQLAKIEEMGFGHFPICMAKNQYSLSDDAKKLGRPENFDIHIREVYVSAGAGFVVALTGAVMTMPGLPKVPAANNIDVTDDGKITGLF